MILFALVIPALQQNVIDIKRFEENIRIWNLMREEKKNKGQADIERVVEGHNVCCTSLIFIVFSFLFSPLHPSSFLKGMRLHE